MIRLDSVNTFFGDKRLSFVKGEPCRNYVDWCTGTQNDQNTRLPKRRKIGADVVRHILRHTAATWLMQRGTAPWQAAGWLAMTLEQLQANYGHHHPDFQEEAATAFGGKR